MAAKGLQPAQGIEPMNEYEAMLAVSAVVIGIIVGYFYAMAMGMVTVEGISST